MDERDHAINWAAESIDRLADQTRDGGQPNAADVLVARVALHAADKAGVTADEINARRRP